MLTDDIKQSKTYQMFIKYSTGLIPSNKTRDKGSQGKKLKDVQTLSSEEKLAANTMQALKPIRKSNKSQSLTGCSSKGTGVSLGVTNESSVILATLSKGTDTKLGVPNEEKFTSKAKVDVLLNWGSEEESEYSKEENVNKEIHWVYSNEDKEKKDDDDDDDDDKSIDIKEIDDKENDSVDAEINSLLSNPTRDATYAVSINPHCTSFRDALQKVLQKHTEEVIQKYLEQANYKDVIKKSVQANVINEVKNLLLKFLSKAVSDFATPVIQNIVKKALERTPTALAQSSFQAQSSLKAADSLSEYELKNILFKKMDKIRSYLTHDNHQALYDALFNSLSLDNAISCGQADPEMYNPSAGPNQGKKTKRSITKEYEPLKKSSTTKESSKGKSPSKTSNETPLFMQL
nr:hypothetical protein [Tanacetum cinerariifolium]